MSITFTDQLDKPSEITALPNQFIRPAFGKSYGFDVPIVIVPAVYNISTRDTEANIQATSPSNPSGSVTLAFGTDTYDLYVWDGTDWYKYKNI